MAGKSSKFRKDDPLYYKHKIGELLLQAEENGVKVEIVSVGAKPREVRLQFVGENGDTVGLPLY